MSTRRSVLEVLTRPRLVQVGCDLGLGLTANMAKPSALIVLSRSQTVSLRDILGLLSRDELKLACQRIGLDAGGREKAQIAARLLAADRRDGTARIVAPRTASRGNGAAESPTVMRSRGATQFLEGVTAMEEQRVRTAPTAREGEPVAASSESPPRKVELVWEGKRTEVDRVVLPFQCIELVNESRATRETEKNKLFRSSARAVPAGWQDGWRSRLIWGDNKYVLSSLLEEFAGKVDLIYIDPPFATGQDFTVQVEVGDEQLVKRASLIEEKAYRDTWGRGYDSYLQMMYERLTMFRQLLAATGTLYVHCDRRVNYMLRAILDDIFGADNLRNEIIWCYRGGGTPEKDFAEKHDTIFRYSKTSNYYFNVDPVRIPYSAASAERLKHQTNVFRGEKVYRDYQPNELGKHPEDWWTIQPLMPSEKQERIVEYPTQKPIELLQRFVEASSPPGGLVLDAFCGGGSTMVAAEGLRVLRDEKDAKSLAIKGEPRRWIGCDISRWAIQVARKRLLHVEGCLPFEVLNLGKYERQYWQGITFGEGNRSAQKALHEYVRFILDLYKAESVTGLVHLHGQRGGRLVHVGAAHAPVTLAEIREAIDECRKVEQTKLDVLGWEWEMGLHDIVEDESRKSGVQLRLLHIPREVMDRRAVDAGDVHFYELAHLEVEPESKGKSVRLRLKNFVIPSPELIPDEVRAKIRKWSDYIDYWSIDFEFNDDTFHNQWQDYRTRAKRDLALVSDWHDYGKPGRYKVLVKVFDIFGNDTTQLLEARV